MRYLAEFSLNAKIKSIPEYSDMLLQTWLLYFLRLVSFDIYRTDKGKKRQRSVSCARLPA